MVFLGNASSIRKSLSASDKLSNFASTEAMMQKQWCVEFRLQLLSRRLFHHNPVSLGTNQPIRKSELVQCLKVNNNSNNNNNNNNNNNTYITLVNMNPKQIIKIL